MNKLIKISAAFAMTLMSPVVANSAIVLAGSGTTVDFWYDNEDQDTLDFGTLQVTGDTIFATPTFSISAANGVGTEIFQSIGSIFVTAKDGYSFSSIDVIEGGTYQTTGNGTVDVTGTLRVLNRTNPFSFETSNLNMTDLTLPGVNSWQGDLSYDMSTAMWDNANSIQLTLTTTLFAISPDGDSTAVINQTLAGSSMGVSINTIPVPAAVWLFGSGLIGLAGIARRKNRA